MMRLIPAVLLSGLLIMTVVVGGCAKKIVNTDDAATVEVAVTFKGMSPDAGRILDRFILLVEGSDFGSLQYDMVMHQGLMTATAQVPYGEARRFVIRGVDKNLNVLYEGIRILDIIFGRETGPITIDVYPVVPAVTMTPHFQSLMMGTPFTVQINAFNLEQLMAYDFTLNYPTTGGLVWLDSIVLSPEIRQTAYIEYGSPGGAVTSAIIASNNGVDPIVDVTGNGHLATCYFGSHRDTQLLYDSAQLSMTPTTMQRPGAAALDTIPLDSVLFDRATVELYLETPPDTTQITWEITYGGYGYDLALDACPAFGGGYMVIGHTDSYGNGETDILLLHIDTLGGVIWQKTIGGPLLDIGNAILRTADAGYVIAGQTRSFSSDGTIDALLLKIDAAGTVLWQQTYNYGLDERALSVDRTVSGDYILGGSVSGSVAGIYAVRTNSAGDSLWAANLGGDVPFSALPLTSGQWPSVASTSDDGFIIAGIIHSDTNAIDMYIQKLDNSGQVGWTSTFGDIGDDMIADILPTTDNNFLMIGSSSSFGAGGSDLFLQQIDASGNEVWSKTFGGLGDDYGQTVAAVSSGGFILGGSISANAYIVRTGANGSHVWDKNYGGSMTEKCMAIFPTRDGGYFAAGYTTSFGAGAYDVYLIKTDANGDVASPALSGKNLAAVPERNGRVDF